MNYLDKELDVIAKQKLTIESITDERVFYELREEWNKLVDISKASIFQSFGWQYTWWRSFGGKNQLFILLFRDREKLVCIIPMFLDQFIVVGKPVFRCLKMIGSKIMQPEKGCFPLQFSFSDYLIDITHPDYSEKVKYSFEEFIKSRKDMFDAVRFDEVPENSFMCKQLLDEFNKNDWNIEVSNGSSCPQLNLPSTWDKFLDRFKSKQRNEIKRFVRRITKDEIFEIQTVQTRSELKQVFHTLVDLHQKRWNDLGMPGIFADPRIYNHYMNLIFNFYESGQLFLKTATIDGQCVAVDLMFTQNGTVYSIQRSFDNHEDFRKYAPGNALLYICIKEAIEKGFTTYDFLRGMQKYKLKSATHVIHNKNITVLDNHKNSGQFFRNKYQLIAKLVDLCSRTRIEREILALCFNNQTPLNAMKQYLKILQSRVKSVRLKKEYKEDSDEI